MALRFLLWGTFHTHSARTASLVTLCRTSGSSSSSVISAVSAGYHHISFLLDGGSTLLQLRRDGTQVETPLERPCTDVVCSHGRHDVMTVCYHPTETFVVSSLTGEVLRREEFGAERTMVTVACGSDMAHIAMTDGTAWSFMLAAAEEAVPASPELYFYERGLPVVDCVANAGWVLFRD